MEVAKIQSIDTFAVIDLGTNTFNLLIVKVDGKSWKIIHKTKIAVKLGEDGISKNTIGEKAWKRGIDAIAKHLTTCNKFNCTRIKAVATSAIRSAANGQQFVNEIKNSHGLLINVIDGTTEAKLIYKGVAKLLSEKHYPALITDIGGGSTEFILCDKNGVLWEKSYPLGVSRLFEMFNPNDPFSEENHKEISEHIKNSTADLLAVTKQFSTLTLIGSSGSFDTLRDIILANDKLSHTGKIFSINRMDYEKWQPHLLHSSYNDRLTINGMVSLRAQYMPIAITIINHILANVNISHIYQSNYALKEGVIIDTIENTTLE